MLMLSGQKQGRGSKIAKQAEASSHEASYGEAQPARTRLQYNRQRIFRIARLGGWPYPCSVYLAPTQVQQACNLLQETVAMVIPATDQEIQEHAQHLQA
jgi:hypothetical protein